MWEQVAWMTATDILRAMLLVFLVGVALAVGVEAAHGVRRFHRQGMARVAAWEDNQQAKALTPFPRSNVRERQAS